MQNIELEIVLHERDLTERGKKRFSHGSSLDRHDFKADSVTKWNFACLVTFKGKVLKCRYTYRIDH